MSPSEPPSGRKASEGDVFGLRSFLKLGEQPSCACDLIALMSKLQKTLPLFFILLAPPPLQIALMLFLPSTFFLRLSVLAAFDENWSCQRQGRDNIRQAGFERFLWLILPFVLPAVGEVGPDGKHQDPAGL